MSVLAMGVVTVWRSRENSKLSAAAHRSPMSVHTGPSGSTITSGAARPTTTCPVGAHGKSARPDAALRRVLKVSS